MSRLRITPHATSAPFLVGVLTLAASVTSAIWWTAQLMAPRPAIAPAVQATPAQSDPGAAATLFGSPGQAVTTGSDPRLASVRVVGVIVHASRGAALLAVDGAPARAYTVGDLVTTGLTLREVTADSAVFERYGERLAIAAPRRSAAQALNPGAGAVAPIR